jgi:arylsulfatase A-like enzyme
MTTAGRRRRARAVPGASALAAPFLLFVGLALSCALGVGARPARPGPRALAVVRPTVSPFLLGAEPVAPRPSRPNILLIISDDQAPGTLGCYGNRSVRTPTLDRLAAEGVRFDRAFVTVGQCAPSRASLLTGKYPHATGIEANDEVGDGEALAPDQVTLAQVLHEAGYATGLVGKWHLGPVDRPAAGFADGWWALHAGVPPLINADGEPARRSEGRPRTAVTTDHAIQFVRGARRDRPWFLWLAYNAPHVPTVPPEAVLDSFDPNRMRLPLSIGDDLSDKPESQRKSVPHRHFLKTKDAALRRAMAAYYADISYLDEQVARLFGALEQTGQADRTCVIFVSDNGWLIGEHQMLGKGPLMYEEQVRVPLIVRYPGVTPAGAASSSLISTVDFFPTLCEVAGARPPRGLHGQSFYSLLSDPARRYRDSVYLEYSEQKGRSFPIRALRTETHKYVDYLDDSDELYDLARDPLEMRNLAANLSADALLRQLRARLSDVRARTGDDRRDPLSDSQPPSSAGAGSG